MLMISCTVLGIGNIESILKDAKNSAGTMGIYHSSWLRDNIHEAFFMTLQRRHLIPKNGFQLLETADRMGR
jgi:hypothetical protein